jgi:hypothetical protein
MMPWPVGPPGTTFCESERPSRSWPSRERVSMTKPALLKERERRALAMLIREEVSLAVRAAWGRAAKRIAVRRRVRRAMVCQLVLLSFPRCHLGEAELHPMWWRGWQLGYL